MKPLQARLLIAAAMAGFGPMVLVNTDDPSNYRLNSGPRLPDDPIPQPVRPTNHQPHQGKKEIARRLKQMQKASNK